MCSMRFNTEYHIRRFVFNHNFNLNLKPRKPVNQSYDFIIRISTSPGQTEVETKVSIIIHCRMVHL